MQRGEPTACLAVVVDKLIILSPPVVINPLTTADIDHVFPTELIINMTDSYNKEKKACALSEPSPSLCIRSRGHWIGGNYSSFISIALSLQNERLSFISLSNYPYSEPMLLASMCLAKGYVAEGLGMIS